MGLGYSKPPRSPAARARKPIALPAPARGSVRAGALGFHVVGGCVPIRPDGRRSKSSNSGTVGGSPGRVPGLYVGRRSKTSRSKSAPVDPGGGDGISGGVVGMGAGAAATPKTPASRNRWKKGPNVV